MNFKPFFLEVMDYSIIIICKNEKMNVNKTLDSILNSKNVSSYEIILINDGSTDGCCNFIHDYIKCFPNIRYLYCDHLGIAGGRNLGASIARGTNLFFLDSHISVCDFFLDGIRDTFREKNAQAVTPAVEDMQSNFIGYGGTWNKDLDFTWLEKPINSGQEVPLSPGGAFAIQRTTFQLLNGFDKHFGPWGYEDQELSLRLWLFGYKIVVDSNVKIKHLFNHEHAFAMDYASIIYNYLWMIYSHFSCKNIAKALSRFHEHPLFPLPATKVFLSRDLLNQRQAYLTERKFDDIYFLQKFNIPFL